MPTDEATPAKIAGAAPEGGSLIRFRWAIALSFLSQFMAYGVDSSSAMLDHELDANYWTGITIWNRFGQSGWETHAIVAFAGLPLLGWAYFLKGRLRPWWSRHGHWAALAILFFCGAGDWHAWGAKLGIVSIGLAVWAVVVRRRELAAAAAPSAG